MPCDFAYQSAASWPRLAWLAVCEIGACTVRVIHGAAVECLPNWFCEAVWDAPFAEGNFDQTDLVFGSGGRRRAEQIVFVSAGSTVDRLQVAVRGEHTFISNSLPCLLEAIGARLHPAFRGYVEFFETVTLGIDHPMPDLPLRQGSVRLVYHHNLHWDGARLHTIPKPAPRRNFERFESYAGFMRDGLKRIAHNMGSSQRARAWSWLGTISRGYDSAASAALAHEAGLRRVITLHESRPGVPDAGTAIADAMGLEYVVVDRLAWKHQASLEPLFLVADGQGKEIMLAGAAAELPDRVLLTGSAGGTAWSMSPSQTGNNLARTVHAGLSMSEYRLHCGFIHLAVPYMGLRQLPDLVRLSRSPEMAPWDTGGSYSRPIPRRLVEEAGVPREQFGVSKTGASIRFLIGEDPWSGSSRRAFIRWFMARRRTYGVGAWAALAGYACVIVLDIVLRLTPRTRGHLRRTLQGAARRLAARVKKRRLNDLAFAWAVESVRKSYPAGQRRRCG